MSQSTKPRPRLHLLALTLACISLPLSGQKTQNLMQIDATSPVPPPAPVAALLGANHSPDGETLSVNSQYLVRDGKPWLPVMGEMHFSRLPQAQWEDEILKMQAAGVDILATYLFWIHHEEIEGQFDWSGDRDLRRFLELCRKHHMYVWLRVGPWSHGEARNGGLPDWVLAHGPTRRNDPTYLREVQTYFEQIGRQTSGLMFKDGGPIIGVQLENEYRGGSTPGEGASHILKLKQMAISVGLDAPFYTVTGWDGAAIPLNAVLPVYGGYPDAPWDSSPTKLPPSEVYAFRWANRAAGNMGALGGGGQNPADAYKGTPFLTAEVGGGLEDTYFRRPVVSPDDIAAMAPVMLGSGANLLGYYMFHGGRNPVGKLTTLQESQRTSYPTDVPVRSYDFQAPLGEFGQEREVLLKLKLVHYFLEDFGAALATMTPRPPSRTPSGPSDLSVPRVGARTNGDSGYLFINNFVRGASMPSRPGFQIELALPTGPLRIPSAPITLPPGAYGIWPVNLNLEAATTLRYSTAQFCKRVELAGQTYYFFFAIPGIAPELLLSTPIDPSAITPGVKVFHLGPNTRLRMDPTRTSQVTLPGKQGPLHLVVMPERDAEQLWKTNDPHTLLMAAEQVFSNGPATILRTSFAPQFAFAFLGHTAPPECDGATIRQDADAAFDGLFTHFSAQVPAATIQATSQPEQPAAPRKPWTPGATFAWRSQPTVMAPEDSEFAGAATWHIHLATPATPLPADVDDVFLHIRYLGDVARLYSGSTLLDDNFFNGAEWTVSLRELGLDPSPAGLMLPSDLLLKVLPLPKNFPMYLEDRQQLHFPPTGDLGALESVQAVPQYQITLRPGVSHLSSRVPQ